MFINHPSELFWTFYVAAHGVLAACQTEDERGWAGRWATVYLSWVAYSAQIRLPCTPAPSRCSSISPLPSLHFLFFYCCFAIPQLRHDFKPHWDEELNQKMEVCLCIRHQYMPPNSLSWPWDSYRDGKNCIRSVQVRALVICHCLLPRLVLLLFQRFWLSLMFSTARMYSVFCPWHSSGLLEWLGIGSSTSAWHVSPFWTGGHAGAPAAIRDPFDQNTRSNSPPHTAHVQHYLQAGLGTGDWAAFSA